MKSVFITGAGGFIGRKLIAYLLEQEIKVTALVLPKEVNLFDPNKNLNIIFGDLSDPVAIKDKLSGLCSEVMYHLAWSGVSTTYKNDISIQRTNIDFMFTAIDLAAAQGCKRMICPGSVSEYAYAGEIAVNGWLAPSPSDLYSATKVAVHVYGELLARQCGLGFNWLLIPSIYGPGREDNNLITYSIKALLAGEKPSYTKLEQVWDYIYIDDLIEALYLIGKKGHHIRTYTVGSGTSRPLREYVEILRNMINPKAELGIGEVPYKTAHIDNAVCDISQLVKDTGYMPKIDFETGIKRTINYFKMQETGEIARG